MKKAVLFGFCYVFVSFSSLCQNFYLGSSGGYAWGIRKSTAPFPLQSSGLVFDSTSLKRTKKSLGLGGNINILGGYTFNSHYAVEAKLNYLLGPKLPVFMYEELTPDDEYVFSRSYGQARRLTLSLLIMANLGQSKIGNPYIKLGPVVPLINKIHYFSESVEPEMNVLHHNYNEAISKSKFTVGFSGTVGIRRNVTKNISVFLEATYQSISISPKEFLTTKVIRDGIDVTNELTISEKKTIYKDELTESSNTYELGPKTLDPNRPYETLQEYTSADHFNVNAGIIYSFKNILPYLK